MAGYLCTKEKRLLDSMATQFCNPDISDVTLEVGGVRYPAHRYVLAMQSTVFKAMLTGNNWKEAAEAEVHLVEDDESCELHFKTFLKFFYTGRVKVKSDNILPLLKMAEKYDVSSLKSGCASFIENEIGKDNVSLQKSMKYMSCVAVYLPELMSVCLARIAASFADIDSAPISCLTLEDMKAILKSSRLTAPDELFVYMIAQRWVYEKFDVSKKGEIVTTALQLLPLIRFYNMDAKQLEAVKNSPLGKLCADTVLKQYLSHAYQVQAEMFMFAMKSPKRRKLSGGKVEHKCSCNPDSSRCDHMNPRLYFSFPYGKNIHSRLDSNVNTISTHIVNLNSLKTYIKVFGEKDDQMGQWLVKWSTKTVSGSEGTSTGEPLEMCKDVFRIKSPTCTHQSHKVKVCIHTCVFGKDTQGVEKQVCRYTLVFHGKLLSGAPLKLVSPLRRKEFAKYTGPFKGKIKIAIYCY